MSSQATCGVALQRYISIALLFVVGIASGGIVHRAASAPPSASPVAVVRPVPPVSASTWPWPHTQVRHELAAMAHTHQLMVERQQAEERASRARQRVALVGSCTSSNWRSTMTADEIWIDTRESGLDPAAENPSGAFGLGQLMAYPHTYDPCLQLKYQREYIASRYGTEDNAVAFWQAHHWY